MRVLVAVRCWPTTRSLQCLHLAAHRPGTFPTQYPLAPPATSSRPSTCGTGQVCPSGGQVCALPALCRRHTWAGVSCWDGVALTASRTRSQGSPGSIPGGGERAADSMTDPPGVREVEVAGPPRMRENIARASGQRPSEGAGH